MIKIPYDDLTSLEPAAWICVGEGFVREEIKSKVFELTQKKAITAHAIQTIDSICLQILKINSDRVLSTFARLELIRDLLSNPDILSKFPEMRALRRQIGFEERIDFSLQQARLCFAHNQEEQVMNERLISRFGQNPLREELRAFSRVYESVLLAMHLYDRPLLVKKTLAYLEEQSWPAHLFLPKTIYVLSLQNPASLIQTFWQTLARFIEVHFLESQRLPLSDISWERWHTYDDAAEFLVDHLVEQFDCSQDVILMADEPQLRATLYRVLQERDLLLEDPRDPLQLKWDEAMKWALSPLEAVASGFERESVLSWHRMYHFNEKNYSQKMQSFYQYADSKIVVQELLEVFPRKITLKKLAETHLQYLKQEQRGRERLAWVISFFESFWEGYIKDFEILEKKDRPLPLRFWWERLRLRLKHQNPPVDRLKPREGLRVYRFSQAPLEMFLSDHFKKPRVWVLGLSAQVLEGRGVGDDWLSEKERQLLSSEFGVPSVLQKQMEELNVLRSWMGFASQVIFLDAQYTWSGAEISSLLPALEQIGFEGSLQPTDHGVHLRRLKSYQPFRPTPPLEVCFPQKQGHLTIDATALDEYSKCSWIELARRRLKLKNLDEPEPELNRGLRGTLLHKAVEYLVKTKSADGAFTMTPRQALEKAWENRKTLPGFLSSHRMKDYAFRQLTQILEIFCEKESEYVAQAQTKVFKLEDPELLEKSFKVGETHVNVIGRADRIDEHQDGLFIIDYKSSTTQPSGKEMLEEGYRLQLPFYAVAAQERYQRPVIGAQIVQLTKNGRRSQGIFLRKYDGKKQGCLTSINRKVSSQIFDLETDEVWALAENQIKSHLEKWVEGIYQPLPKKVTDCDFCEFSGLCGRSRLI